ncbi:MAG: flippase-like domain-containing protein [Bacteroidales bacterium]|nr:flippase-like domain-containing protein [Bacteroidales bacterium]
MKDKIKKIIKLGFFISLSVILLYLAFRNIDLSEVFTELREAEYLWVLLALAVTFMAHLSRTRRWVLLIKPLGYKPRFTSAYHSLMIGYLFNFAAPRLGELTRCVALGRKEKIPVDRLFGTVIAERVFDLISMFIIMFIMLLGRSSQMDSFLRINIFQALGNKISSFFGYSTLFIILLLLFHAAIFILFAIYRKRMKKMHIYTRTRDIIKGVFSGLKTFIKMKDKAEFILHSIIIWSFYIIMTWVIFFALPSTSHLHFGDAVFILVIGSLGMAAPVQGGIGAFHWIVSRGLNVVYDIDLKDALAYATLSHESQLVLIAILGTISFYFIMGRSRRAGDETEAEN